VTSKLAFVGRFLAAFALLIAVGWATNGPARYAALLQEAATISSPVLTGWWLETRPGRQGPELWFRHTEGELRLLLSLESLALGLLPLLALLSATPGLGLRRFGANVTIGCAAFFALDLLVVLLYPILVSNPNTGTDVTGTFLSAVTDITGFFLGLLTFVGGPVIIWFVLTFDQLRSIWRLDPAEMVKGRGQKSKVKG
jgi:hypothetical protein